MREASLNPYIVELGSAIASLRLDGKRAGPGDCDGGPDDSDQSLRHSLRNPHERNLHMQNASRLDRLDRGYQTLFAAIRRPYTTHEQTYGLYRCQYTHMDRVLSACRTLVVVFHLWHRSALFEQKTNHAIHMMAAVRAVMSFADSYFLCSAEMHQDPAGSDFSRLLASLYLSLGLIQSPEQLGDSAETLTRLLTDFD